MTRNIKIQIFIPLFILVFYTACSSSDSTKDISTPEEGWYKTKWGMTLDEIRTVLREEIKEITPENRGDLKDYFTHMISDFKIGNFTFDVYLGFDAKKELNNVLVILDDKQDKWQCFVELERSLKKKYGSPSLAETSENEEFDYDQEIREWLLKNTFVQLSYLKYGFGNEIEFTQISYQPRKDTSIDKI